MSPMDPSNAEERNTINEWLIEKQREEFRRESERNRLAQYRLLDDEEAKLGDKIRNEQELLSRMGNILQQFISKTESAIADLDAGKLLDQRKQWAKSRAAALAKWEKTRGVLEAVDPRHVEGGCNVKLDL